MLISTNRQINSIFSGSLNNEPLYFSKRNQAKTGLKAISFESAENIHTLQPFDRLVFFAILTHTQSGGGVVSLRYLYRIITGVETPLSEKTRTAIRESIERLSKVILQPIKHITSKKTEKSAQRYLISYSETEKGYLFEDNYFLMIINDFKTARTIPPEMLTKQRKGIKTLLIEYDFIARLFYLHKSKKKTVSIKQDINLYCERYKITASNKPKVKRFLIAVCNHLQQIGFIKSFHFSGDLIEIS